MTIDPRPAVVDRRLEGVRRIYPVTGGKGGVGKSTVASLLALVLAESGRTVGLLDLDLTGPCGHLILGAGAHVPQEEFGVDPQIVGGIRFMSVSTFAGNASAPLRGDDLSNALLEMLAITRWGELDALVLDMPPGLSDTALDAVRLIPRAEYVAVTTASGVVLETVRRNLSLLGESGARVAGVLENMRREESARVPLFASELGLSFLGAVPWDDELETAMGSTRRLLATRAAAALRPVAATLTRSPVRG
jgi:ATP-binding protein involved in chromosome partitioning